MFSRLSMFKFLTAAFLVAVVFTAGAAQAATKVKGILYSVNSAANSVTLKSNGLLTTINLSPKTKLIRNKVSAPLSGLVLGDKMTVVYRTGLYPSKLKAQGPRVTQVQGRVSSITPSGMVTIGTSTFKATAQTRIARNGKVASLDEITSDDDLVAHVEDSGDADDIDGECPDETEVRGTITAVDVTNNTVTFLDSSNNSVTVNVTPDTMIEVGDATATINDLAAGMLVEVNYDPTTFNAFRIEAEVEGEDAEIEGTVTAVDAANGTVTIQDSLGNSVTVIADAGTRIERDGEPAFLTDIMVGDAGKAEYDVNTFIANEIEAESPDSGDDTP
ncbi:MAG TPA: DUF5666 domain-containing protein [Acidobacteriota bacterium]|nr:DUF5666 domain-containing protein [Acidobacteriota bacterium]